LFSIILCMADWSPPTSKQKSEALPLELNAGFTFRGGADSYCDLPGYEAV
jgi:hypothetical protein